VRFLHTPGLWLIMSFGLIQRGLKGRDINLHQRIADADRFAIKHFHKLAIDTPPHRHGIHRSYATIVR
jgi:hypothetical protein